MERAAKQRKKLEELKAKAEGKTNEAKVTAKKRIIDADASARFAEVAKDHLHNLAQAMSFLEVRENPNKALADSKGLDAQLKKINAMEEKVHPSLKKKARSDLADAKETALAAEKRRAPLLKVLSKAQQ